ncbi:hypothetical protein K488DRAFT_83036 [Vararia minispora EC-137]|uniref:Uncharacterized protein n=1 Tax=Vararia minispora EC-137 TaxID=1314806 RepID=A0ACB8QUH1_9AGAM|nr:hypothetical protein K488DRAFT_83036 [Vararia minispora EC-137]
MPATRLHLKRTAAEQAERELRKARKARAARACAARGEDGAEEARFREKTAEAAMEDEYAHGVHARFEAYGAPETDPWMMEEEYAERKNARAHEEEERRRAAREAAEAEARRMLRAKDEARALRRRERRQRRAAAARASYEARWRALVQGEGPVRFADVPWPVFDADADGEPTPESVGAFLRADDGRARDRLRQALLRFHPDKFDGRLMPRVVPDDRDAVRQAVAAVARALAVLIASTV